MDDVSKDENNSQSNVHNKQGTSQHTPEQKGKGAKSKTPKSVRKKLFPERNILNNLGKLLEDHPWDNHEPNVHDEMPSEVEESRTYPTPEWWKTPWQKVDLEEIDKYFPQFVYDLTSSLKQEVHKENHIKPQDHRDKPSLKKSDEKFKAFSLEKEALTSEGTYQHLDCEYILKMYLPNNKKKWFDTEGDNIRIKKIAQDKKDKRWIFTPSYGRSKIALLNWPEDICTCETVRAESPEKTCNCITEESTIRILVVRPSQFKEYVTYCGYIFPIISLPNDEDGVGYARLWIQKIAWTLTLKYIWMIDDSLECFYEYHPELKPNSYKDERRLQFGVVFQRIEKIVKDGSKGRPYIAAMSPRKGPPGRPTKKPFACKPPQCAVYLNLQAIMEHGVLYRPQLPVFEDMMFAYECEKKGLKVFRDNRIQLQDHQWSDTGCMGLPIAQKKDKERGGRGQGRGAKNKEKKKEGMEDDKDVEHDEDEEKKKKKKRTNEQEEEEEEKEKKKKRKKEN